MGLKKTSQKTTENETGQIEVKSFEESFKKKDDLQVNVCRLMNEANSNKKQPLLSLTTTPTKADMYADNANLYSSSLQSKSSLNQTDDEENKYDTINGGDDSSTIIKKESISTLYENCTNAIQHLRQNIHQKRAAEDLETKEILQNVYRSNKNAM